MVRSLLGWAKKMTGPDIYQIIIMVLLFVDASSRIVTIWYRFKRIRLENEKMKLRKVKKK